MKQRTTTSIFLSRAVSVLCASICVSFACGAALPDEALAVTAAEKRAEAEAVYEQIDSLQTNLNKAMAEYDRAQSAYENALKKRDAATESIEKETARFEALQSDLSQFAVGVYKTDGATRFLDVLLDASTFEHFLTSLDACNAMFVQGEEALDESRAARKALEKSKAQYQKQSDRAAKEMDAATAAQAEIEQTQAALRTQAEQLSAEAAELQRQEELAAEAARQAEEARQRREAELAAAAEAADAARQAEEEAQDEDASDEEAEGEGEDSGESEGEEEESYDEDEEGAEEEEGEEDEPASSAAGEPFVLSAGSLANPCPSASYSSGFGYRDFDSSFHMGLDMAAPEGTPYYAAASGTVMYATNDGGYNGGAGNWIVIAHGNGLVTKYMHSSATYVVPGDYVESGQNIGAVGNTGNSFGAHLHFQVEVDGVAVNPLNYL